ncbi:MAG: hypothetical protein QOH92_1153 [Chloroflexota bacterium]|jgi:hypothetical protein|nr:hypothetical protein [Chloroflexota bacterium]
MKLRLLRLFTAVPVAGLLALQAGTMPVTITANAGTTYDHLTKMQKRILSGFASLELNPATTPSARALQSQGNYKPTSDDGCPVNLGSNIKVNQNCLNIADGNLQGRGQAQNETTIAQDPVNPNRVVASSNDYRRGDGGCFTEYSRDGGSSWTDTSIPMGFTSGTNFGGVPRQYWQAGGDPAVAWDTKGNAYMQCMVFQRGPGTTNNPDLSSAVYVFRSTGNGGASWNFLGRPAVETYDVTGAILNDKPYMTIDTKSGSPFQDRIYMTWTLFAADGSAYIYEVHSNDYGQSFSSPVVVSRTSALCVNTFGAGTAQGNCNQNQFSDPFTGSDGSLYVVFANYNNALTTATDNHNQVLLAKSVDGGATFSAPIKVSDYYDLPDCNTYQGAGQDPGRACVPEKGASNHSVFRAANYPVGSVNPRDASQVAVTVASYINPHSNEANGCVPTGFAADGQNTFTGVKTPGACNNDILLSVSNDGGTTFTGQTTDPRQLTSVTQAPGQATTDQFWQWATFTKDGRLAVSYYDRQYGIDETNGSSDIALSGSKDLVHFATRRVTSSSMPYPTQFPNGFGNGSFLGDYSGLSAVTDALPLWSDTRSPDLFLCPGTGAPGVPPSICTGTSTSGSPANDQDIFTAKVAIPSGGNGGGD